MVHGRLFFALLNPIVATLFSIGFAMIWLRWREYRHLPALSVAFFCLAAGFVLYDFRLLVWPTDVNLGANAFYIATVSLACTSALQRKAIAPPVLLFLAVIALGALPFAWYLFVEPSLKARI
ncbi:MAG: hypothetical protein EOP20_12365, partial [Hyphomicrobiales bacterium]